MRWPPGRMNRCSASVADAPTARKSRSRDPPRRPLAHRLEELLRGRRQRAPRALDETDLADEHRMLDDARPERGRLRGGLVGGRVREHRDAQAGLDEPERRGHVARLVGGRDPLPIDSNAWSTSVRTLYSLSMRMSG